MKQHNRLLCLFLDPKTKSSQNYSENDEDDDYRMVPGVLVTAHDEEEDEKCYGADEETETEAVEVFEGCPGWVLTAFCASGYEHWAEV
jgi:hypothetical protein